MITMLSGSSKKMRRKEKTQRAIEKNISLSIEASSDDLAQRPGLFVSNAEYMEVSSHSIRQGGIQTYKNFNNSLNQICSPKRNPKSCMAINSYRTLHQNSIVLHLGHPCQFQLCGYLRVTVLYGRVHIFGNILDSNSLRKSVILFGSKTFQSFLVETKDIISDDKSFLESMLRKEVNLFDEDASSLLSLIKPNDAVILVEDIQLPLFFAAKQFVTPNLFPITHRAYTQRPDISKFVKCAVDGLKSDHYTPFAVSPEWEALPLTQKNIVFGGVGTGKSTFCKFMINKLLQSHSAVLYLELDIGQTEFTPPGGVAAVVIKEPVLGPNFTHILTPERMFHLGEVDSVKCSTEYLQSVEHLVRDVAIPHFSNIPWVVNTMGFCQGLGLHLARSCINIVQPTTVIQVISQDPKNNFKINLRPDEVRVNSHVRLNYSFHRLQSIAKILNKKTSKREARERMILSYFSPTLTPPYFSFNTAEPYCISFSALSIGVKSNMALRDVLRALNGSLVSLCEDINSNSPGGKYFESTETPDRWFRVVIKPSVQTCIGLGLIRGIDVDKRELYVLSPLDVNTMQRVRLICMSHLEVPPVVFVNQEGVEGLVPYTANNTDDLALVAVRRVHRQARHVMKE